MNREEEKERERIRKIMEDVYMAQLKRSMKIFFYFFIIFFAVSGLFAIYHWFMK